MTALSLEHCRPLSDADVLEPDAVRARLEQAPGWSLVDGAIQKRFDFTDFHRTMAFVNALAWIAHVEDHHPELLLRHNRCTVRLSSREPQGITINDFICAAKVDALMHTARP